MSLNQCKYVPNESASMKEWWTICRFKGLNNELKSAVVVVTWSACLTSIPTVLVWMPLKSTIFIVKFTVASVMHKIGQDSVPGFELTTSWSFVLSYNHSTMALVQLINIGVFQEQCKYYIFNLLKSKQFRTMDLWFCH